MVSQLDDREHRPGGIGENGKAPNVFDVHRRRVRPGTQLGCLANDLVAVVYQHVWQPMRRRVPVLRTFAFAAGLIALSVCVDAALRSSGLRESSILPISQESLS